MLEEARRIQTPAEKRQQAELAGMMHDPIGKVFVTAMTDQCFRSQRPHELRSAHYVIKSLGIPHICPKQASCPHMLFAAPRQNMFPALLSIDHPG